MNSPAYTLPPLSQLRTSTAVALERVATALARLDERIGRLDGVGEGYRARIEYQEACALRAIAGELVTLEDLVLSDAGTPIRLSTVELMRARIVLKARRKAAAQPPHWAWSDDALFDDRVDVQKDELLIALGDEDWDPDERVDRWRGVLAETAGLPATLQAAIAWDAWLHLEPFAGGHWRSTLMAASVLRVRAIARHHLPVIGIGGRKSRLRYDPRAPFERRVAGFLDWVSLATEAAEREIQRLVLAEKVLRQVARHTHRDSRLPELIDLLIEKPLVSAELAKSRLQLSDTGFRRLRESLGTSVRELSGRSRYRMWGLS
jgi:hypothetical protein